MFKKLIIIAIMLQTMSIFSQQKLKIELNSGLYSKFLYDSDDVSTENNFHGLSMGLTYAYHIQPLWGIEGGILFSTYGSSVKIKKDLIERSEIDDTGSGFTMQLSGDNLKENINMYAVEIPIRLFFDSSYKNEKIGYYASLGGKFIQPISQNSTIKSDNLTIRGYYPNVNVTIDDLPQHGFGTWNNFESETELNLKSTIAISAEFGINFTLDKNRFYIGLFGDYGLLDMNRGKDNNSFIKYNAKGKPNKAFGSPALKDVKSIELLNFGLQVKYRL